MKLSCNPNPRANSQHAWRKSRGLTLVETAVAAGVGSLILVIIGYLSLYAMRSFASVGNYGILNARNRIALDRMARDIRQAEKVQFCFSDSHRATGHPQYARYGSAEKSQDRYESRKICRRGHPRRIGKGRVL